MSTNAGIDYSLGQSNRDANGIHYGVISSHTVGERWYEAAESDYGEPTCPECESKVESTSDDETDYGETDYTKYHTYGCDDYVCHTCKHTLDSDSVYSEEPLGQSYQDDEYTLTDCLDSDVFVLKAPYYTFAQYCSPCVPGAGNLDTPCADGPKTYCLGHDWFEGDRAPYPVYRVSDDSVVEPGV